MACVITAPSSSSGKTLLSLVLISWAKCNGISIQPFKVGPDYLDPQLLTLTSNKICRNLDLILTNPDWVKENFYKYGGIADLALIEGVMGLFDGLGYTQKGSTAEVASQLNLPIVLIVNARSQAASLAALVKGFRDHNAHLKLAGVVLNQVNTTRHQNLLKEVLNSIDVKTLGALPNNPKLAIPSRYLGLIPAHEISDLKKRMEQWSQIAEQHLDLEAFQKLLKAPVAKYNETREETTNRTIKSHLDQYPIAIAQDQAFHFRYQETKEYLEDLGMPLIAWKPTEDEEIPKESRGLIIPGGFPEQFAEQISQSHRSLSSIKSFYGRHPIYAECGGMLLLGKSINDYKGKSHRMADLLPFHAKKGNLTVGYRKLKGLNNSLILKKGEQINGHEFHHWQLEGIKSTMKNNRSKREIGLNPPWEINGWGLKPSKEGWSNRFLHASWVHLHWPSSSNVLDLWLKAVKRIDA